MDPVLEQTQMSDGSRYRHHARLANAASFAFGQRVTLQRGTTPMQAWFQNADETDLAGAFYAYVRRVENK